MSLPISIILIGAGNTGDKKHVLTSVAMSLDSHLMAWAAEESRLSGKIINMAKFEKKVRSKM
jgi:hypothetical protein